MEFDPEGVPEFDWDEDKTPLPEQEGYKVPSTSSIPENNPSTSGIPEIVPSTTSVSKIAPSTSSIPELSSFQLDVFVGSEVPTSVLPSLPSLNNILYHRYGYLFPIEPIEDSDPTMSLHDVTLRVCEGNAPQSSSNSEQNAMWYFLNLLIGAKSIPHSLCDLRDGSLLKQYNQGMITVERRQGRYYSHNGSVHKNHYLI